MVTLNNPSFPLSDLNQRIYNRLQQALSLKLRRQIYIAVCDDLNLRNVIVNRLQTDLLSVYPAQLSFKRSQKSGNADIFTPLMSVKIDLSDPNPLKQIAQWQRENAARLPQRFDPEILGFQIFGVEHLTRQPPPVQWSFLQDLRTIETYRHQIELSLLLWITSPWLCCIQQSALEFWQWHTGVFEFVSDPTPSDIESNIAQPHQEQGLTPVVNLSLLTTSPSLQQSLNQIQDLQKHHPFSPELTLAYRQVGTIYRDRIVAGEASELNYTLAIQAYEKALQTIPEPDPLFNDNLNSEIEQAEQQINLLNDLGTLYWMRFRKIAQGNSQSSEALSHLEQSIIFYQNALMKIDPEQQPDFYIRGQKNLGTTYSDLATIRDQAKNLEQAIVAYTEALRYLKLTPLNEHHRPDQASKLPDYAAIQNNLGTTYWKLAQHSQPILHLKAAITAYLEALRYYSAQRDPLNHAMLQTNLGTAYWTLSQHQPSPKLLLQAIHAYHQALNYRTPEKAPVACAATYNNLGIAYWHLANHYQKSEIRAKFLKRAIAAYQRSISIAQKLSFTQLTFDPLTTHNNLGLAHYQLATDPNSSCSQTARIAHLKAALQHHLQADRNWQPQPTEKQAREEMIKPSKATDHHQTTLSHIIKTVRAFYNESGLQGQNQALSQIPGELLSEILRAL